MPRLPDLRPPAEPSSAGQRDRQQRMLAAAIRLGGELDFERVQMQDVAAEAGVAIATLYRYFPSKVHLFVGVMKARLERLEPARFAAEPGADPVSAVADLLVLMTRELIEERRLSLAMIQSIILAGGLESPDSIEIERIFTDLLVQIAGWGENPTGDQRRRAWLVGQCWFGVLMITLNRGLPIDQAEQDIHRACELLLAG